ncbi:beta-ribofuranosylaminobenzene 5'-phosphate synthase family protein [Aquabacterium sp. OR-4]|uniref:beta-ribofuranosylaminobenzene 5'-phosphate synthase family protein n=1 Tax=Aquabacterium sp. OR-4 TaxID=2978127 RepID=UPI0021B3F553|nr:beta-ribofuranosylaminobenzene 5'-phosphate synthase family protein [Aquabacterium sp. OR-4]MDT7838277.1 beta-ribofuranosylaminobenzene 5'-phosphate synthase [Aquabacterium sp. OR-4]
MLSTLATPCPPGPQPAAEAGAVVTVSAPGRLHLGFLDPAGSLGRRFGSVGLVIDGPATELSLGRAGHDAVLAGTPAALAEAERASAWLHTLRQRSGCHAPLRLQLHQVLPAHAGFGSGTQLALALGRAFARLHGLALDSATLAHWLGRGLRSGIGIAGFDQGGLLLDGGPGADGRPAPLLARLALPEAWRVVLVLDPAHRGLSGPQERSAMASLPPLPQALAADICHQVLMRVLPGAAGQDFALFAAGVTGMQQRLGAHFAAAQGGSAYTNPAVGRLLHWMADSEAGIESGSGNGIGTSNASTAAAGIGQSSWGPTGFAIVESQARAEALCAAARRAGLVAPGLVLQITRPRQRGAEVAVQAAGAPSPRALPAAQPVA